MRRRSHLANAAYVKGIIGIALLAALVPPATVLAGEANAFPIRFDRYSVEEGLSQATVLAIHQDSRGFIWTGTEDGLNRFDGHTFEVFRHDPTDPASLSGTFVWSIDEDSEGRLWIATEDGGLAILDETSGGFERVDQVRSERLRAVLVDEDTVWVGTRDSGVWRLDAASRDAVQFAGEECGLGDDRVFVLHRDNAGRIWVGTDDGLYVYDRARDRFSRIGGPESPFPLSGQRIRSIADDANGEVWIGTFVSGLNALDPSTGEVRAFRHDTDDPGSLGHDRVRSLLLDESHRLWAGTSSGLNLLVDRERGRFARYEHDDADPQSLADGHVMDLLEDRSGVLWVGTRFGGLHKWNSRTWQFGHRRSAADPLAGGSRVTAFTEDTEGRVWIAEFGQGVSVLDAAGKLLRRFSHDPDDPTSLSSSRVTALHADSQGETWIGTLDAGLNRADFDSGLVTRYAHSVDDGRGTAVPGISSLLEDRSGALWVGTFGGGVHRLDREHDRFQVFRHDPELANSLTNDRVTALGETRLGQIWVGTHGGGLFLLDPLTGQGFRFRHSRGDTESLPSNLVYAIHVDSEGRVWAGTNAGLCQVILERPDRARFRTLREDAGLPNAVVYAIEEDAGKRLWMSTNNGLAAFDPETGIVATYNRTHGLQGNEFNYGASFRDRVGRLYFGGLNGYNVFDAAELTSSEIGPSVVLRRVEVDHEPLDRATAAPGSLELGYRNRTLTLRFAALDFIDPSQNRFSYRLEGFDGDWIDASPEGRITYTNLDPGSYVLRVRARSAEGVWNDEPFELGVRVGAPPWRQPWAYGGYTLSVIGCLFGFVRLQERKVQREALRSRELESKVQDRTRDLAERSRELEQVNRRLAKASITDSLTGFANRRFLVDYLEKEIALMQRRYSAASDGTLTREAFDLAFLMLDLDEFKGINDTFGHAAGDEVLRELTDVLSEACRDSDIVIRWGGDEFLIVARDLDVRNLSSLAERIRTSIAQRAFAVGDGRFVRVTCSIGYACYPFIAGDLSSITWEQALSVADRALYTAKHSGRNAWVGLEATPKTDADYVLPRLRDSLEELSQEGQIRVHTSLTVDQRSIVWTKED